MCEKTTKFNQSGNIIQGYFGCDKTKNKEGICMRTKASGAYIRGCPRFFPLLKKKRGGFHNTRGS